MISHMLQDRLESVLHTIFDIRVYMYLDWNLDWIYAFGLESCLLLRIIGESFWNNY